MHRAMKNIKSNHFLNGEFASEEIYEAEGVSALSKYRDVNNIGPFFSHESLLSNISLPSIVTDCNRIYYGANQVVKDFNDIFNVVENKVVFKNRKLRERFFDFSKRVFEINPKIFNLRETFSIFDYGLFKFAVSLKSVNDMYDRSKIIISILNFDSDRVIDHAIFGELFGLTPAENRLAAMLVNGKSVIECAEELGVRISTVREQLSNIFAKTRTSRQPELVSMLSKLDLLV
ncbi:MAG: hypothetical protein CFE35_14150 [Novosphingobium sp. PASSN1]|nr:MAG: hypothetical protein CFE35_14150 [Novosphingobium sp. PASSN1]